MADQGSLSEKKEWIVRPDQSGIRLDAFVRYCLPHLSRRSVENAIDVGVFRANERKGKKGDRLVTGDVLSFIGSAQWLFEGPVPEPGLQMPVIYEDPHLLVVDKPAGMDTYGFSGRDTHTLANFLAAQRPETVGIGTSRWEPGIVHRLDRETSGLVLVAKTQLAFEHLRSQFRRRQVTKKYWALVWGEPKAQGSIDYPLAHDSRDKRRMRTVVDATTRAKNPKRWNALTRFRKLTASEAVTLLEIDMETGVTHQIRVHLAAIGHPIVGDALYGAEESASFRLKRHFLHAFRLGFRHPEDGRIMKIEAALPKELQNVLRRLRMSIYAALLLMPLALAQPPQ